MKTYTKKELEEVLRLHKLWLDNNENGVQANLSDADLSEADLRGADLSGADLRRTALRWAYLSEADLSSADLSGADLRRANLSRTFYNEVTAFFAIQCPEEGQFVAWKKCKDNVIVKLLIPDDAKRSSATSRKCRASKAVVLEVFGAETAYSQHDTAFAYTIGQTIEPEHPFDEDRWNECGSGIHFFITRQEAENY